MRMANSTGSFAWPNSSLVCGECHCMMDCSVSKNTIPAEFRCKCGNPRCANYGKIFRPERSAAFRLIEITDRVCDEELKDAAAGR